MSAEAGTGPVDPIGTDLARILRALKLSGLKDTLPERLITARTHKLGHAAFLELLLADELNRRDSRSAALRAARAGLDPPDQRLLRNRRRTPPPQIHHHQLQPRTGRMARDDQRHPARPIRHRPAHPGRPHPSHRRSLMAPTQHTEPACRH
jgi:hypothetical protein